MRHQAVVANHVILQSDWLVSKVLLISLFTLTDT